jgi:hypothetical protein
VLIGLFLAVRGAAQVEREYFMQTPPFPAYQAPERPRYNIKLGKMTGRFGANVQFEVNDNINLSERSPAADFFIGPYVSAGFLLPLTKNHVIQFDLGGGYRYYVRNGSASSLNIAPNTHLDYTVYIDDVRVTFHDRFSIQVDPVTRGEIAGQAQVQSFRRFVNAVGFTADWQATRRWGFFAGYDYSIDRSLNETFQQIDRDAHTASAGINYTLSSRVKTGVLGSYTTESYNQRIQNNGQTFTVGPSLSVKVSPFLTFGGSAGYTVSTYDRSGTVQDDSSYRGMTYQTTVEHQLNRNTSHSLRFSQSAGLGFGSNFTDTWSVQYGVKTVLTRSINLNGIFAYENLRASGRGGEQSGRYLIYLGTGYQLTRLWSMGLSYSFSLRDSDARDHSYLQNRLTLDLTRRF